MCCVDEVCHLGKVDRFAISPEPICQEGRELVKDFSAIDMSYNSLRDQCPLEILDIDHQLFLVQRVKCSAFNCLRDFLQGDLLTEEMASRLRILGFVNLLGRSRGGFVNLFKGGRFT